MAKRKPTKTERRIDTTLGQWAEEFGAEYAVPASIYNHPEIEDVSWHNDISPSFTTKALADFDGDDNDDWKAIRLWVDHPDPKERESETAPRFSVFNYITGDVFFESHASNGCAEAIRALVKASREAIEAHAPKAAIFIMELSTRHFDFRVFGRTPEECRDLYRAACVKHCVETGADPKYFDEVMPEPVAFAVPGAYRDDMKIA